MSYNRQVLVPSGNSNITCYAVSKRYIALGLTNNSIDLYEKNGQQWIKLPSQQFKIPEQYHNPSITNGVKKIVFSPDENYLIISDSRNIHIANLESKTTPFMPVDTIIEIEPTIKIVDINFLSSSLFIIINDNGLKVFIKKNLSQVLTWKSYQTIFFTEKIVCWSASETHCFFATNNNESHLYAIDSITNKFTLLFKKPVQAKINDCLFFNTKAQKKHLFVLLDDNNAFLINTETRVESLIKVKKNSNLINFNFEKKDYMLLYSWKKLIGIIPSRKDSPLEMFLSNEKLITNYIFSPDKTTCIFETTTTQIGNPTEHNVNVLLKLNSKSFLKPVFLDDNACIIFLRDEVTLFFKSSHPSLFAFMDSPSRRAGSKQSIALRHQNPDSQIKYEIARNGNALTISKDAPAKLSMVAPSGTSYIDSFSEVITCTFSKDGGYLAGILESDMFKSSIFRSDLSESDILEFNKVELFNLLNKKMVFSWEDANKVPIALDFSNKNLFILCEDFILIHYDISLDKFQELKLPSTESRIDPNHVALWTNTKSDIVKLYSNNTVFTINIKELSLPPHTKTKYDIFDLDTYSMQSSSTTHNPFDSSPSLNITPKPTSRHLLLPPTLSPSKTSTQGQLPTTPRKITSQPVVPLSQLREMKASSTSTPQKFSRSVSTVSIASSGISVSSTNTQEFEDSMISQSPHLSHWKKIAVFSDDGEYIAVQRNQKIEIFNLETRRIIFSPNISVEANCFDFSPNKKLFAIGTDSHLFIYNINSFCLTHTFPIQNTLYCKFHSDGKFIHSGHPQGIATHRLAPESKCAYDFENFLKDIFDPNGRNFILLGKQFLSDLGRTIDTIFTLNDEFLIFGHDEDRRLAEEAEEAEKAKKIQTSFENTPALKSSLTKDERIKKLLESIQGVLNKIESINQKEKKYLTAFILGVVFQGSFLSMPSNILLKPLIKKDYYIDCNNESARKTYFQLEKVNAYFKFTATLDMQTVFYPCDDKLGVEHNPNQKNIALKIYSSYTLDTTNITIIANEKPTIEVITDPMINNEPLLKLLTDYYQTFYLELKLTPAELQQRSENILKVADAIEKNELNEAFLNRLIERDELNE